MEIKNNRKKYYSNTSNILKFTGNWFIDAGILGFVNLMEEVYGWNLEELQIQIKENTKLVYYWYFPIAFAYYNNKLRGKTVNSMSSPPENLQNPREIFENAWKYICSNFLDKNKDRIDLSSKGTFYYFHNLLFFQPQWNKEKQKNAFMEVLRLKDVESDVLKYIDKTINKFLPSTDEFHNVSYSKSFITLENLLNLHPQSLVFVLSFPFAFIQDVLPGNILFYSPNLEFTYHVNKKLTKFIMRLKNDQDRQRKIFQITWRAVIDSIIETQSIWTLENMYLIKYILGKNQNIFNVEYIGIPKLQASVILDDLMRDMLNKNVPARIRIVGKRIRIEEQKWLIEEFIKDKPLLPCLINYLWSYLNTQPELRRKIIIENRTLIYANSVDAQLREFGKDNNLFSNKFFGGYRSILFEIKENTTNMFLAAKNASRIFNDLKERERAASKLLSTIKKRNKYAFTNALLKSFIGKTEKQKDVRNLNRYLFDRIVSNDINWENYALAIVIGLIYGGVENGEFEETED